MKNDIDFKGQEAKKVNGIEVHWDGLKPTYSPEWRSVVVFVR